MERQYYYLAAGLEDLALAAEKQTVFVEPFVQFLEEELHPDDFEGIRLLLLANDNRNLLYLLTGKGTWTSPGLFTHDEMETAVKTPLELPEYQRVFIGAFRANTPLFQNLGWEDQLAGLYYEYALETDQKFLIQWLEFEQNLRNVLVALNCRKRQLPMPGYLVGSDAVTEQLLRSTAGDFGLGKELPWLERLLPVYTQGTAQEIEKTVDEIKWAMADELADLAEFGVSAIYAYFIKLSITERWFKLAPEAGDAVFKELVNKLKSSFVIDEEILS